VTLILKDSLINLPVMTGPQAVERMVELFGKDQLLAALGADCVQAIAAEQEACVALLEDEADDWRTAARRTGEQRFHAIAYGLKIAAGKVRNREEC